MSRKTIYRSSITGMIVTKKHAEDNPDTTQKEIVQETFTLEQLITFGYYVRKNPNTVMRKNYIAWKEQFESGLIPKAVIDKSK